MQRPQIDLTELKDYQTFSGNGFLPPKNYIQKLATIDLAVLLCDYFWPEFILFDECYFRKVQFDTNNYYHWKEHLQDDKSRVETVVNHWHICDLFSDSALQSYSYRVVFHIALIMQQTWEAALKMQYPELNFKVEVFTEEGLVDPQVTFHLVR
jgi:hypothetical protein